MGLPELRAFIAERTSPGTVLRMDGALIGYEPVSEASPAWFAGMGVALLVDGEKHLRLGDRTIRYGSGDFLLSSMGLPVTGRFTDEPRAAALGVGFAIDPLEVAELLGAASATGSRAGGRSAQAVPAAVVGHADDELLDAVLRLAMLLDHPTDRPVLLPLVRREILWLLLTGPEGETVRQMGLADSDLTRIGRAAERIRAAHRQALRVEDLAREATMSTSVFHRRFREVMGTTPIGYRTTVRLQEARRRLAGSAADVAEVGRAVGYDSPSQFSRDYRHEFGITPGQERARFRSPAPDDRSGAAPGPDRADR